MKKSKKYSEQIKTGVWVDHQLATIVSIQNDEIKTEEIKSGVVSHERFKGETTDKINSGSHVMNRENHKAARAHNELKKYYENIISKIQDSSQLYVFGPAEAKFELENEIIKHKPLKNISVVIAASDKMSKSEVVAEVKKFYS